MVSIISRFVAPIFTWIVINVNVPDITVIPRMIVLGIASVISFSDIVIAAMIIVKAVVGIVLIALSLFMFRQEPNVNSLIGVLGGIITLLSCIPIGTA